MLIADAVFRTWKEGLPFYLAVTSIGLLWFGTMWFLIGVVARRTTKEQRGPNAMWWWGLGFVPPRWFALVVIASGLTTLAVSIVWQAIS